MSSWLHDYSQEMISSLSRDEKREMTERMTQWLTHWSTSRRVDTSALKHQQCWCFFCTLIRRCYQDSKRNGKNITLYSLLRVKPMHSINQINILGNICSHPTRKELKNGDTFLNFQIATNRSDRSGQTIPEYHSCVAWGTLAMKMSDMISKWDTLYITGRLQYSEFQENDVRKKVAEIHTTNFSVLQKKSWDALWDTRWIDDFRDLDRI